MLALHAVLNTRQGLISAAPGAPVRPTLGSKEVRLATAEIMLPRFKKLLDYGDADTSEDAEIKHELAKAVDYASDGYEMCRRLEQDSYWEGSTEMVELCEDFFYEQHHAHKKLIADWVTAYDIKLNAKICSRVRLYASTAKIYDDCELADIDEKHATVSIYCPALHVRAGTGSGILYQTHDYESKFWEPIDASE